MSASLVGSEMCIRDSGRTGASGSLPSAAAAGGWAPGWAGIIGISTCQCSVSYTHLTLPTICSV
eukprot:4155468-Alexandrium_andersonii.AAC.1